MVKSGNAPIVQIIKCIERQNRCAHKQLNTPVFKIAARKGNNIRDSCFKLSDSHYCFVVYEREGKYHVKVFNTLDLFYKRCAVDGGNSLPLDSSDLGIYRVQDLDKIRHTDAVMEKSALTAKVVPLPYKSGYVLVPFLHKQAKLFK